MAQTLIWSCRVEAICQFKHRSLYLWMNWRALNDRICPYHQAEISYNVTVFSEINNFPNSGGAELLCGNVKKHDVELPEQDTKCE